MVASLDERRPEASFGFDGAVNIVGTGGGPPTFNISTAAALTAATIGVPVVKTGSARLRAASGPSTCWSVGVPPARSLGETAETLERGRRLRRQPSSTPRSCRCWPGGDAAGPPAVRALPQRRRPLPCRPAPVRPGHRRVGPGLRPGAALPGGRGPPAGWWLCTNDVGADELVGFADNVIEPNDGTGEDARYGASRPRRRASRRPRPAAADGVVDHFLAVVSGEGLDAATDAVCLNAAAMAVAGGHADTWVGAVAAARDAVRTGAVRELVERVRVRPPRGGPPCRGPAPVADTTGGFFADRGERPGLALFLNAGDPPLPVLADVLRMMDDERVGRGRAGRPVPPTRSRTAR